MIMDPVSRNYIMGEIEGCMYMCVRACVWYAYVHLCGGSADEEPQNCVYGRTHDLAYFAEDYLDGFAQLTAVR